MMLEHGREHHCIALDRQRARELVDRLGRVLREHDDIALWVGADELADEFPCPFECVGAESRLVPRSTMDARIERQEPLDGANHRSEGWCAGRVVEIDVWHEPAIEQRDRLVGPHERVPGYRCGRRQDRRAHRGNSGRLVTTASELRTQPRADWSFDVSDVVEQRGRCGSVAHLRSIQERRDRIVTHPRIRGVHHSVLVFDEQAARRRRGQ